MNPIKLVLIGLAMTTLAACTKNIQWEEEVLLNTGETIWVTKKVSYSIQGQPGNPADMGYLPDPVESISFKYGGRNFSYRGDASEVMVLAISPQKVPVLLAPAGSRGWDIRNSYKCSQPHYVQFVPDSTGVSWEWPKSIESWTYNLPTNLMLNRDHPTDTKPRYTMADKLKQGFWNDPQLIDIQKVNPLKKSRNCIENKA